MTSAQQVRLAEAIQSMYALAPVPPGWTLLDRCFVPQDPTPTALVLRDEETGKIAMPVRGSETRWDWRKDFSFLFGPSPFGTGRTEQGFTSYYLDHRTESGEPIPAVDWFGGHSLGGPGATLFGCGNIPGSDLLLIATPEPGDKDFAAWASMRFANIHRWENPHDVVPDAPGRFLGYADLVGPVTVCDMTALGVHIWDEANNHHLPNYIESFKRGQGITP